jgi:uncharacterized coiled-coil protein SlyX
MGETEHITVAETSDGPGGTGTTGEEVSLPVVELLTGRGFITGKSGSGKSNSASVVAEKLLDSGFGLFIVDIDGEYYGLKEEYEILHAGADEECDIQVTSEHAEKLASLALEQNVPVILDVSSYLDESEAEALLTDVARSLFAKAKKQKQPFLLLVEEVHEYIPEQGSVGECGKMLIKIGKRGRKHGLGICGISQRPADVKKDFITQCDWLLWHRLTWNNDTKVVRRILDGEYASAVEDLDDGEGFLVTDWSDAVRRVQFYRKRTFDAGATPGLEDVERPDLKSVSDDLVSELQTISEETGAREDRIAELEARLGEKEARIEQLETELAEAQDLQQLAQQFVDALVDRVEDASGQRASPESRSPRPESQTAGQTDGGPTRQDRDDSPKKTVGDEWREAGFTDASANPPEQANPFDASASDDTSDEARASDESSDDAASGAGASDEPAFEASETGDETAAEADGATETDESTPKTVSGNGASGEESDDEFSAEKILSRLEDLPERQQTETDRLEGHTAREEIEIALRSDAEFVDDGPETAASDESADEAGDDPDVSLPEEEPLAVRELKADIGGLETKTRRMLVFYREHGPATAPNAHFAAGGDGERVQAYARNRTLRTHSLVEHVGRGRYDYHLRKRLADELSDHIDEDVLDAYVADIEAQILDS